MKSYLSSFAAILLVSAISTTSMAHELGSNINPIAFGNDQTIIDLEKLEYAPLKVDGLPEGGQIAVLRGDLKTGTSEIILKFPPNYKVPSHTHSSDEVYVWLKGAFTLTSFDGKQTKFSGPAYISFPGNAPPHALECGSKEDCILYLRYSRPFDIIYPKSK
ncbi:MAG: cupin domain-containing protein [Methylophilaceae bacterium]